MYTWAGDVDLNGVVDAVDYGTIDNWIQFPGTTGYTNGDLNYDGVIDAVDYGIIDNGIQLQGPPIPVSPALPGRRRRPVGRDGGAGTGVAVSDRPRGREPARSPSSPQPSAAIGSLSLLSLSPLAEAAHVPSAWAASRF